MTRRTGHAGRARAKPMQSSSLWVAIFAVFQLWAAVPALIEMCSEGACQLLLTLPVVFVAVMDAWHGLRTPPHVGHDSSIASNHGEEEGIV